MKKTSFFAALFMALCSMTVFAQPAPGQAEYTFSGVVNPQSSPEWGSINLGDNTFAGSIVIDYSVFAQVTNPDMGEGSSSNLITFTNAIVGGHLSVGGASWDIGPADIAFFGDDNLHLGDFGLSIRLRPVSDSVVTFSNGVMGRPSNGSISILIPRFQYIDGATLGDCVGIKDFSGDPASFYLTVKKPDIYDLDLVFQGLGSGTVTGSSSAVPEPASWGALAGGLALAIAAGFVRCRRRRE